MDLNKVETRISDSSSCGASAMIRGTANAVVVESDHHLIWRSEVVWWQVQEPGIVMSRSFEKLAKTRRVVILVRRAGSPALHSKRLESVTK